MSKKQTFTRKPFVSYLYKWSPENNVIKTPNSGNETGLPVGCTAIPFSQGQDWVTAYVYDFIVVNGQEQHLAYVECDYVR